MKKVLLIILTVFSIFAAKAQSGTEFWFAPPDITALHNAPEGVPIYLNISTFGTAATVTIDQPANAGFTPIVVTIPANGSSQQDLSAFIADLETRPTNIVVNTGLRITSTATITAYYEVSNTNNTDIFALKGKNSLGQEFYIPLQNHAPFYNNIFAAPDRAFASFDIVATENNTTVMIYSPVAVDGHPALTPFTITLQKGQTYSCGFTGTNFQLPVNHPSGAVVLSDKDVAVTIKDDSGHNPSGSCYDLMGDQIVPVKIVGTEYIAVKGQLNNTGDESVFILATQNNTKVYFDGSPTPAATLFAGQTFRYDMDYLAASSDNSVFIETSKPAYVTHVTGFGCEEGQAILPPLGCAGSEQISFTRSTSESFFLNILVRAAAVGDFTVSGAGTATIDTSLFKFVPGTANEWKAARLQFNTTQIPVNSAHLITNSSDVFSLAIINGGGSSGCRYGFFSEFASEIVIDAGVNSSVCANDTFQLGGAVSGGTTTGMWTTSGSGQFIPSDIDLNAQYVPSPADISAGAVSIVLTSTGNCTPVSDAMNLNITPAPTVDAGADVSVCKNKVNVNLIGTVTIASGGIWSGGSGSYSPNNTSLITTYTPSAAEITAGTAILTLTSTGNGTCNPVTDNITITITPSPIVDAGSNQSACKNNSKVTLSGSVTGATGGVWSGGTGNFSPNTNTLNADYTPSAAELLVGFAKLKLTTNGNGTCNPEVDSVIITYTTSPTVSAGADQTLCANNATATLNGSRTIATGVQWSGGLGVFSNATANNTTYKPTAADIGLGYVDLYLTTTGNNNCNPVKDTVRINYSTAPTANAGADVTVCENNRAVSLNGAVTIASGGTWTGGSGTFASSRATLVNTYTPSSTEVTAGKAVLVLKTTGNGTCLQVGDTLKITITPKPIANAGLDRTACKNNPNITLSGSVTNATGGVWSGGGGFFTPSTAALNAVYSPSTAEITAGSVTLKLTTTGFGNCKVVIDSVKITYTNSPTVSAGSDQTLCANNAVATLVGTKTVSTGVQWSGGLGLFSNSTSLNTTYTPTALELANGSVSLIITTTGNSTCTAVKDTVDISYTPAPVVNAGTDFAVCANTTSFALSGSVTVAGTGGAWTGGGGTFSPSATSLTATYAPTPAEITAGSVTLTLTSTGNGNCTPVTDDIKITFNALPTANAGPNAISCANNPNVNLAGVITNATGGIWSGGSGFFNPSNTDLNAVYTPTPTEITAGTVTLTLTSTGNGTCAAVNDQMTININPKPIADAGLSQSVCSNNANINLIGSVNNASGGQWSGGLGIFTPSANALNAVYTPTAGEILSGSLVLTLTTTGNGSCLAVNDTMKVTFTPSPTVDAGINLTTCANNPIATLIATKTLATGVVWSGGAGAFNPSNTSLNPTYTPTTAEIAAGVMKLFVTTTGNANCNSVTDSLTLTIVPTPLVNAGVDQTICVNNLNVILSGSVSGSTNTGIWATTGSGIFIPNNTALNATYRASSADSIAGNVKLILQSTNNGSCIAVSDTLNVAILSAGNANAGSNVTVCGNNANVNLNGSVSGGATTGVWTTTGTGSFVPNNALLTSTYVPSANDISLGSVKLILTANSCDMDTSSIRVTITPAPVVSAGNNQTICASNLNISLLGSVTGASTTGVWTTNGSGTFLPNANTLNATYKASAADSVAQQVRLILSATGIGNCLPTADTIFINIFPTGSVNAGPDQTLCANNANVVLNGIISGGASKGRWTTTGTGTFVPSDTVLTATYLPSSNDTILGGVRLKLKATNSCNLAADSLNVIFSPAPTVNAGPPSAAICGTNPTLQLNGTLSGALGAIWTTNGTGTFAPNNTDLNAIYSASAADIANGSILLTLTTTANGSCLAVIDSIRLNISSGIVVNAGNDQIVCATAGFTQLNGSVSNGSSTGKWTTLGSGTFTPNDSLLTAEYNFSNADTTTGFVFLILTSTNNGSCGVERDTVKITFGNSAFVDAGSDQVVCASSPAVNLNGLVSGGASIGRWRTLGSGTFSPADTVLNAIYTPSATDIANGFVNIVLNSVDHGSCTQGKDTMRVTIQPIPVVNAGSNIQICAFADSIPLTGNVTNALGGTWFTNGTGTFAPNDTALTTFYKPSTSDLAAGSITLYLRSRGNTVCSPVQDSMVISLVTPLIVNYTYNESCKGKPVRFTDSTQVTAGTITAYSWDFGDGGTSTSKDPIHIFAASGTYDVTLIVTSSLGCDSKIIKTILVNDGPKADFGFTPTIAEVGEPVTFSGVSTGAVSWDWRFGDGFGQSTLQTPQYTYTNEGTYNVIQVVANTFGCTDTASKSIVVRMTQSTPPQLPTGFSPNGDGENDVLFVLGGPFTSVDLKVYNNWGNLIFNSNGADIGWDGTWKGKAQDAGDYIYTVKAITTEGEVYEKNGSVSIIR